ncbi:uncharacterized protein [Montipora capricornis]|uniref:uncharacterized protein n=1 Tax=Montipora capricornis TaxID=246305 RepID=UPI0035F197EC
MDQDISFDLQYISITDNQSSIDVTAQLHRLELDRRLPKGSEACEELFQSPVFQPLPEDQEEQIQSQFVFHGQCLVLGDSRVEKTSLVRSLIGEPFDPGQVKTQGIEERLVDKEWKTLDVKKDLAFGNFRSFFKAILIQLMLFSKAGSITFLVASPVDYLKLLLVLLVCCIVNVTTSLLNLEDSQGDGLDGLLSFIMFVSATLILYTFLPLILYPWVSHLLRPLTPTMLIEWIRVTVIRKPRLLTIGVFLSVMTKCFLGGLFKMRSLPFCGCQMIIYVGIALSIGTVGVLLLLGFLLLKGIKAIEKKRCHPCQHKFIATKITSTEMISFWRFVFTVFTGYMICLIPLTFTNFNFEFICDFAVFLAHVWHLFLAIVLVQQLYKLLQLRDFVNKLILLVCGSLYLMRLPPILYFFMLYVTFFFYTLYTECLYMYLNSLVGSGASDNEKQGENMFSAVVVDKTVLDVTKLKSELNRKFSFLKMKVLDFAGDREYYSYHHLFLRHHALYIIVFNLEEWEEKDFMGISRHIQRLQFWMQSVCSHVPRSTPILLVGTHRGNMDNNCLKILDDHLRRFLWKRYCDELVANDSEMLLFFPVENSLGNMDNGIEALQRKVVSVAEKNKKTIGREIPLSWIQIQDAIISLKENPNARVCITLAEFQRTIDDADCNTYIWSKETLEYFHEKGLIIYVDKKEDIDLSNWILLNPEILVDIVIQLVTPSTENTQYRGLRHDWGLLQRKGILTKALLQSIICKVKEDEEAITAFLEQYDLICPLEYKATEMKRRHHCDVQATHFVPSLLPLSADGDKPVWHDHYRDKKFYVLFNKFLPDALFHRLLSRAQKNSNVEFPSGQTVLYRDAGKFWMNPYLSYKITLMEEEKMIEIAYNSSRKNKMKPSDVLCQVFSMVDGICRKDFPFIKFHCGPACPSQTCPGYQDDFFTSLPADPSDEDSLTRRCHVYNVLPGRQRDRTPFLYCEDHSFEEELEEWIP